MDLKKITRRCAKISAALVLQAAAFAQAYAAGPRVYFDGDGHCPPAHARPPKVGFDIFTAGTPPKVTAWLIERYHWDDGEGNDLTVESFCIVAGEYLTLKVTQSKNGKETVIAEPGGVGAVPDPGHC